MRCDVAGSWTRCCRSLDGELPSVDRCPAASFAEPTIRRHTRLSGPGQDGDGQGCCVCAAPMFEPETGPLTFRLPPCSRAPMSVATPDDEADWSVPFPFDLADLTEADADEPLAHRGCRPRVTP